MKRRSIWKTACLFTFALCSCSSSGPPLCGAEGQPCCNSVECNTGFVCLSSICTVPGGGGPGGGGGGSSGSKTSSHSSNSNSSGSGATSSQGGSSSGSGLPGDTCALCTTFACNGATDRCVCDPNDFACANGYCGADCYNANTGAGDQTLCTGGTQCLQAIDEAQGAGDDGFGDDYVCYPASGTCIGVSSSSGSSSSGGISSVNGSSSSSGGASSTVAACGGAGQACCGNVCDGSLTCGGGICVQPTAGEAGTPCSKNADCTTGICLPVGQPVGGQPAGEATWTGNVCTTNCNTVADCVAGWSCAALAGQSSNVCQCHYSAEICDGKDNDCNGIVDDEPQVDQACERQTPLDVCQGGACTCAAQYQACGSCVDLSTDPSDCGSCGNVCQSPRTSCAQGGCGCPSGGTFCGSVCTNVSTDPHNCGSCGNGCTDGGVCKSGACSCPSGETSCSGSCTNTGTDPHNCGTCGNTCPSTASCNGGTCLCPSGQTDCFGTCTDITGDPNNCGSCGNACPEPGNCGSNEFEACMCSACICCDLNGGCLNGTC